MHYAASSPPLQKVAHQDHVFSALHMGVTLHGRRDLAFMTAGSSATDFVRMLAPLENIQFEYFLVTFQLCEFIISWFLFLYPHTVALVLPMTSGDVYVSTPAGILHAVQTSELGV
jgi:hypothetical protein